MRALFTAVALLASPLALAEDGTAPATVGTAPAGDSTMPADDKKGPPSDADLDKAKEELAWHKDQAKQIDKLIGKWEKYVDGEKFDKAKEVDAELKPLLRDQMGYLRDMGVANTGDDLPASKGAPAMVGGEDQSKMEQLRDAITEVRTQDIDYAKPDGQKVQTRRSNLELIDQAVQARYERKDKQYDEMKEKAKG